jgi:hypothetical protein
MDDFKSYLKSSLKPRDSEFYECEDFDETLFQLMVQDAFMITRRPAESKPSNSEYISIGEAYIYKKCARNLAWLDETTNTFSWDMTSEPLYRRLLPPPNETINHTLVIQAIILAAKNFHTTYIEYGVRTGLNLHLIGPFVEKTIGVDIADPAILPKNVTFYKTTTDNFSAVELPKLSFYYAFIDADHKYESVIKDFENIYKYIQPGGYIFLHDTYPCAEVFLSPELCNDCYKTPIEIKKRYPEAELVTLPLNPGLTIVRKPLVA